MPESKVVPYDVEGNIYRYDRDSWLQAGVDDFTRPSAQNPDMFLQLTNILPPATGVLLRRFGYDFFNPALDNGANIDSDRHTGGVVPTYKTPYFSYENTTTWGGGTSVTVSYTPTFGTWAGNNMYTAGTSIADSNNNVQRCVVGGLSNNVGEPTWPTTPVGTLTTDGSVTWELVKYAISIGDQLFMPIQINYSTYEGTSSITDSSLNSWTSLTTRQDYYPTTNTFQVWSTLVGANVNYGSTLTILVSFPVFLFGGDILSVVQWSNLGTRTLAPVQMIGNGTAASSGSLAVPANNVLISFAATGTANSPWTQEGTLTAYLIPGSGGTFSDSWTLGSSSYWATSLVAYPFAMA